MSDIIDEKEKSILSLVQAPDEETRGRKPHSPTEKNKRYVRAASRAKCKIKDIAKALNISEMTLKKYYSDQLAKGNTDLPRVAQDKLYNFLNKDFTGQPDLEKEQAKIAMQYLRSDTLKKQEDENLMQSLPSIIAGVKKASGE